MAIGGGGTTADAERNGWKRTDGGGEKNPLYSQSAVVEWSYSG